MIPPGSPPPVISGTPLRGDVIHYNPLVGIRRRDHSARQEVGHEAARKGSCAVLLAMGLWTVTAAVDAPAKADGVEYLMVPSAAMGRDIPVAFQAGGPHAVVPARRLQRAPPTSADWVTAGNAMNTLAGSGVSVAAPAGGAWSLYTNWEQDGSKQWETFLADRVAELAGGEQGPGAQRARCRRRVPGRHRRADAGDRSTPTASGYAGSLSGFLTPSAHLRERRDHRGHGAVRRGGHAATCGARCSWAAGSGMTPTCTLQLLVDNNTRLWIFSPQTTTCSDARGDDRRLRSGPGQQPHVLLSTTARSAASNGHFDFPTGGQHDWGSWSAQLAALRGDLVAAIA